MLKIVTRPFHPEEPLLEGPNTYYGTVVAGAGVDGSAHGIDWLTPNQIALLTPNKALRVIERNRILSAKKVTNQELPESCGNNDFSQGKPTSSAVVSSPLRAAGYGQTDQTSTPPLAVDRKWKVPSSDGTSHYDVTLSGRTYACTCKGFQYRGYCKHSKAVMELVAKEGK